jgi:hypothetical protein
MGYKPIHRGINHDSKVFKYPKLTDKEYKDLVSLDVKPGIMVKGVMIPTDSAGTITIPREVFNGRTLVKDYPNRFYHEISWERQSFNMPKGPGEYRSAFKGTEMVLTNEGVSFLDTYKRNKDMFDLGAISGGIKFGEEAKTGPWLPFIAIIIGAWVVVNIFQAFSPRKKRY